MISKILGTVLLASVITTYAVAKEGNLMKGNVSKNLEFNKENKVVKPLFSESFKVMGIGLTKGQKLEKHQTPTAACLYVESGKVTFSMKGEVTTLLAGDYFSSPPKEMHEVEAQEDSRLMLIK